MVKNNPPLKVTIMLLAEYLNYSLIDIHILPILTTCIQWNAIQYTDTYQQTSTDTSNCHFSAIGKNISASTKTESSTSTIDSE